MDTPEKTWQQCKWGVIGVVSCALAYAAMFYGLQFNGAFPQLYLAVTVLVFPLTVLSWYLAFASLPRFYRVVFTLLATWVLLGITYGCVALPKLLP